LDDPWHTCACDTVYTPISPPVLRNAGPNRRACHRDTVLLGVDERQDSVSFQWRALGDAPLGALSDPTAPITRAQFSNTTGSALVYRYVLATIRAGQCSTSDTVAITVLPEVQAIVTAISDYNGADISCHGYSDGALEVSITAGAAPFTYRLGTAAQDSSVFAGLSAGQYTFYLEDADGCTQTVQGTLTEPAPLELALETRPSSCADGADGRITAFPSGGAPEYQYAWSNGIPNGGPVADMIPAGTYFLTLTDSNGCRRTDSTTVDAPARLDAILLLEPTSCADSNDGSAALEEVSGGTAPHSAIWSDGRQGFFHDGLSPGWHQVTVTDANGCTLALDFETGSPPPLLLAGHHIEHVRCHGARGGAIRTDMEGGTPPYAYLWNHGYTGQSISALPAGYYQATITDANGCRLSSPAFLVEQPALLELSVLAAEPVSCHGDIDGMASVAATGGSAPYSYRWEHGDTDSLARGLPPAVYGVTVTDANGCQDSARAAVGEPEPIGLDYQLAPPNCTGRPGMINFLPPHGTGAPPFLYSIDGGRAFTADSTFRNLEEGIYLLAIQDSEGCEVKETVQLLRPPPLSIQFSGDLQADYGEAVTVVVEVSHAQGELQARWSPADGNISCIDCLSPVFTPGQSTTYHLAVIDENGCRADTSLQVLVNYPRRVFIPNAFSPNGDGKNDVFLIYGAEEAARVERMIIAGRWGNILFRREEFPLNDPKFGWDGRFRGQRMPAGVYVYEVEVLFSDGLRKTYRGEAMLMD
ncbi:MAG: gliding motility-associated C-terminal domain-containing protein, partial [Phaeodactylibacter sp.]|nr:gliding motility-associated C-terminal domain-containing protein [Phaeodactylibacter sp.]